ncbi:hypothetical protein JXI42_04720 [bacterium]|nr:hypothetical protein [bacterium]
MSQLFYFSIFKENNKTIYTLKPYFIFRQQLMQFPLLWQTFMSSRFKMTVLIMKG